MTHLLDANACIDHLRRGPASTVSTRLDATAVGSVVLCSVVVAELVYGAYRSSNPARTLIQARAFCRQYASLPFDDRAAEESGKIRSHLASLGTPIGPHDLIIAAIAIVNGLTLVTHNTKEFSRVPGLAIEDRQ